MWFFFFRLALFFPVPSFIRLVDVVWMGRFDLFRRLTFIIPPLFSFSGLIYLLYFILSLYCNDYILHPNSSQ